MSIHRIPIHDANVIQPPTALRLSVERADELDLAERLEKAGGEIARHGRDISALARLDDQPSIFNLADALAILHAAERAVCVYAVARGLKLAMAPIVPPCDCGD